VPVAVKIAGQVDDFRPVVEHRTLPIQPFANPAPVNGPGVPLMIGWCENEQRLALAPTPDVYRQSAPDALARTARVLGVGEPDAAGLVDIYRRGRPGDAPGDLYAQIHGDHRYRRNITCAAERQSAQSRAPVYLYAIDWKTPVLDGLLRTPHTLCVAFAFGNVDLATGITGLGTDRYTLQDELSGAWLAFARSGDPNHPGLPVWPTYEVCHRATMMFGRPTRVSHDPWRDERIALDGYPPYAPSKEEGRLRSAT
jgi:para-nitrobenzyl esterase